jgi:phospholipid-binding lipoprotein MlaA
MKISYWFYILSALCLIILPGLCTAENEMFSSPSEVAISISPPDEAILADEVIQSDEAILAAVDMEPVEPSSAMELLASFHPDKTSFPVGQEEGPMQLALANIPPPRTSKFEEPAYTIADPLEPINRAFFHFNDKFYFWILKPAASGYKVIIPEEWRVGVRNFFSNVATPIRLVNCLLQANFKGVGTEAFRFLINTTFGVAGLIDPAKTEFHIEKMDKDFGQTLGIYGMKPILYINWPILGPSTIRETIGYIGDLFLDPQNYLVHSIPINLGIKSYAQVNETSLSLGDYEDFKKSALDPYVALKDAYYQYRQHKIKER